MTEATSAEPAPAAVLLSALARVDRGDHSLVVPWPGFVPGPFAHLNGSVVGDLHREIRVVFAMSAWPTSALMGWRLRPVVRGAESTRK